MEEPSLLSLDHSVDMVLLHWVTHDDARVWRAPAESAAIGLMTTFHPEVLRFEIVHLFDEDTAGKLSYRSELAASPLPDAMRHSFATEWQQIWALGAETESMWERAGPCDEAAESIDIIDAVRVMTRPGSRAGKTWLQKIAEEEAADAAR